MSSRLNQHIRFLRPYSSIRWVSRYYYETRVSFRKWMKVAAAELACKLFNKHWSDPRTGPLLLSCVLKEKGSPAARLVFASQGWRFFFFANFQIMNLRNYQMQMMFAFLVLFYLDVNANSVFVISWYWWIYCVGGIPWYFLKLLRTSWLINRHKQPHMVFIATGSSNESLHFSFLVSKFFSLSIVQNMLLFVLTYLLLTGQCEKLQFKHKEIM